MKIAKKILVFSMAAFLSLPGLSASALSSNGTVGIVEFPHHDLGLHAGGWINESRCANSEINSALTLFESRDDFKWNFEQSRFIYEYLLNYPQKYDALKQAVQSGQLSLGAGYTDPFTSFLSSEMLVRELILGKKWNEDFFGGSSNLYFDTDIPGLSLQMPQILRKADVDYLYLTRSNQFSSFEWDEFTRYESPDGTRVNAYFENLYANNQTFSTWTMTLMDQILDVYEATQQEKKNLGNAFPHVYATDMLMPSTLPDSFIEEWNSDPSRPRMDYALFQDILETVFADADIQEEDIVSGEWPCRWVYEASSVGYNNFKNQRDAERYLRDAEALFVIRALMEGNFTNYPSNDIEKAWRAIDHSCHSYTHSEIPTYTEIWDRAIQMAKELYDRGLDWLISQVATELTLGQPFVVYNDLAWTRDDIVIMDKPADIGNTFRIVDESGVEVVYQMSADGQIVFLAEDVPSLGYKTYYIKDDTISPMQTPGFSVGALWTAAYENDYYLVTPANTAGSDKNGRDKVGGLEQIRDLEIGKDLFDTTDFNIAEWKDFYYPNAMGANPAHNMRQPEYNTYESVSSVTQAWTCIESGPVRTVFESKADTDRGPIITRVNIYNDVKKIDLEVVLEDNDDASYHQQRLMFPINAGDMFGADGMIDQDSAMVSYEAPFGVVNVGDEALPKFSRWNDNASVPAGYNAYWNGNNNSGGSITIDGQTYTAPAFSRFGAKNTHYDELVNTAPRPRFLQNWISAGDDGFSVTISSYNLAWDYQDPTTNPGKKPVLQPMLVSNVQSNASGQNCWTQPGRIEYHFSITSDRANYAAGSDKMAIQANNPLNARPQTSKAPEASIPEQFQGLAVDKDNVIVTSIKKAEDDNENIILRFYEARGLDDGDVTITFPSTVNSAKEVNLLERETGKTLAYTGNTVTMNTSHWSIETAGITFNGINDTPLAPFSLIARQTNAGVYLLWMNKGAPDNILVEMKSEAGKWRQIALLPGDAYTYTFPVPEGRYQFRVRSVVNGVSSGYVESEEVAVDFSPITINHRYTSSDYIWYGALNNVYYYTRHEESTSAFGGSNPGTWWSTNADDYDREPNITYSKNECTERDYYSIMFTGSQIELYTRMDNTHGYAAVSIDGGPEEEICLYAPITAESSPIQSFYTSQIFTDGLDHTVKVRYLKKAHEDGVDDRISFSHAVVSFEMPTYTPVFTDKNGDALNSLSTEFINVAMPYTNTGNDPVSLTMIVAVCDPSGRLAHNAITSLTVGPSQTETFKLSLNIPQNADGSYALKGYYASVFLWDSVTFAPILPKFDFSCNS